MDARWQNRQRQACVGRHYGRPDRISGLETHPEIGPPFLGNREIRWLGGEEFSVFWIFTFRVGISLF